MKFRPRPIRLRLQDNPSPPTPPTLLRIALADPTPALSFKTLQSRFKILHIDPGDCV